MTYTTHDSGKRTEYPSGFKRDTAEGKPRYDLIPLMPLKRLAELYTRGAEKYGENNWQKAKTSDELDRFKQSAMRHMFQWAEGDQSEDHAIAVVWNLFAFLEIEPKVIPRLALIRSSTNVSNAPMYYEVSND